MIRFLGLFAVLIAIAPLLGLFVLIIFPPVDPFGGSPPGFSDMVQQSGLLRLAWNSVSLSLLVAIFATCVGGWLAWIEHRCQYPGKKALLFSGLLVLATPSYILAATLSSRVGKWLEFYLHIEFNGFLAALCCLSLVCIPYGQLTISSALARISGTEEEAAISLGANTFRAFKVAIWPQIQAAFGFSFLISFLYAISDFGAVATLDIPVLTWRLYEAVRTQDLARAAVLGLGTILTTLPIFLLANRIQTAAKQKHTPNPRKPKMVPLNPVSLLLTYILHATIICLGLILPVIEMTSWVIDGFTRNLPFISQWDAIFGSVFLSIIGAILTILLVLSPAWLSLRSSIYKNASYLASALPGVLLAFGLMICCLQITKFTGGYAFILSSGALLFMGYSMRFMAEAFGPIAASIRQFNPRLTETAKSLNRYPNPWIKSVFLPHITPSVLRAFLIVFLACIKELPITLLLGGSTGFKTLAFRTWDRYNEALWHDAGVSGLSLLLVALLMTIITLQWKRNA